MAPRASSQTRFIPPTGDLSARPPKAPSYLSSQSNEADDELSEIADMGPATEDELRRRPQWDQEDVRLTSAKEVSGFYAYGWAAEVFVICGMASFIPITLEQLARERGTLLTDRTRPCETKSPIPTALDGSSLFTRAPHKDKEQCVVNFFGVDINTASFAMYTFSISVLLQALLIISMSGAADHGRYRKTLLLTFAFTGATATMLFLPLTPNVYILAALLAIIGNVCHGASNVLLNSFLPLLVRYHPFVQYSSPPPSPTLGNAGVAMDHTSLTDESTAADSNIDDSTAALLAPPVPDLSTPAQASHAASSPELQISTKLSSYGMGIGYLAAGLLQTISMFIVIGTKSTLFSLRLVLFVVGLWWFLFTIPAAMWLRPRPGPPLDFGHREPHKSRISANLAYVAYAWKSLWRTIKRARRLRDVMFFLAGWFLLSDGIATISGTAVLFAKTSLGMEPAYLALFIIVTTIFGVVGAFGWSRISRILNLRPSHTILACIAVFEIIPLYALLGYIPAIQRLGVFGLQQQWELYPLGGLYGFVLGGLSAYCRSVFGELIPPGSEAAFYALYAITDKGSSVFGPAIVGAITDATGEIRPAFWFLAVLVGLPFPLIYMVDVERGRREGAALSRELEGRDGSPAGGEYRPVNTDVGDGDEELENRHED
ncbi:MAG: Autophagy protein 22 [Bathelium mastoideum]|nr:MAG: Autophagy protein 22 [Bathelium mastoideum]KAI9680253.1 MAG: Autophagy protein 22 [Bathelium mastoideum]